MFLIKLFFTLMALSILGTGIFGFLANNAKSYEEEIRWTDYVAYCGAATFTLLGIAMLSLIFLP